ncbi:MAG: sensor histidine kinase [Candidatus Aminicenantia bacterium]
MIIIALIFTTTIWGSQELIHQYIILKFPIIPFQSFVIKEISISSIAVLFVTGIDLFIIKIFLKIPPFNPLNPREFLFILLINLTVTTIFISIHYASSFYQEIQKRIIAEKEAKEMATKAEFKALKAQINPHFLFNTLNSIAALTRLNPGKAEKMIENLAEIFRYTLQSSQKELITLKQELDLIDTYIQIEKARLGERLKIEKKISPENLEIAIPSLIIQPVVENAIKHGVSTHSEIGKIKIIAHKENKIIKIRIEDNGPGIPKNKLSNIFSSGTGLQNISDRLEKIYGQKGLLEIENIMPHGLAVTINIPENIK